MLQSSNASHSSVTIAVTQYLFIDLVIMPKDQESSHECSNECMVLMNLVIKLPQ